MKVVARENDPSIGFNWDTNHCIIPGKCYDAELSPTLLDPQNFEPKKYYTIHCEDGVYRNFEIDWFIPIDVRREQQLNKLGI